MHSLSLLSLLFLFFQINVGVAHQTYVAKNPNGANVPGIEAIGHTDGAGGPQKNNYGLDFKSAGTKWTAALCTMDSDNDGQSNGLELGDPCCRWIEGADPPTFMTDISHPGDSSKTTSREMPACPSDSETPSPTVGVSATSAPSVGGASATPEPAYTEDNTDMIVGLSIGIPTASIFLIAIIWMQIRRCTRTTFKNHDKHNIVSLNDELLRCA